MSRPSSRRVRRAAHGRDDDDGQVMVLTLGFTVIALALVLVVAAATSVHLERKRLLGLADLAVLAAADEVGAGYYAPGADAPGRPVVPLTDADVRAAVERYLAAHPEPGARWDGVVVLRAEAVDERTATVRLGAVVHPALLAPVLDLWSGGIGVEASSTARAW